MGKDQEMKTVFGLLRRVWKADAFSPAAFVARAVLIAVCYCVSELAGLREYTTFLSGTSANLNVSWQTAATVGLIHLLLYVAFILLAPVSLLTAGLLLLWDKWSGRGQAMDRAAQATANLVNSEV
jgi:hypothetical protein